MPHAFDETNHLMRCLMRHIKIRNIERAIDLSDAGEEAWLQSEPEVLADARKMLAQVEAAAALAKELEDTGDVWTAELRKKCGQPSFVSERGALEALFGEIDSLIESRAEFLKRPVEVPEPALVSQKAREAVGRGAETGKPFGMPLSPLPAIESQASVKRQPSEGSFLP